MILRVRTIAVYFVLLLLSAGAASAETVKCTECGMTCDLASKFIARIVQRDQTNYFCDVGDLFSYLNRKKPDVSRVEVRDYESGAWTDAHKAYFVRAEKKFRTPMGWGIAAFADKGKAAEYGAAMDLDAAAKAVK